MSIAPDVVARARRLVLANAVHHGGLPRKGPIISRLLGGEPNLRTQVQELDLVVEGQISEVSRLSREQQESELARLGGPEEDAPRPERGPNDLPELPNAVAGEVVLRMAPFPSGTLHIGNARMLFVNDYYRTRYKGKNLLVFDDTPGSEEKRVEPEFFDLILGDLELAGVRWDSVTYKSDRVPRFYPWARRVIDAGAAYVCRCSAELLRENRRAGRACPERGQTTEATLDLWDKMLSGSFGPGEAVLRLRTDLNDPDPAFRDRVLFRISDLDHPRVGHRYRVWPLLEFSWAVDDVELGVTHVIRGKDLMIEDRMEQRIWELLGLHGPPFVHWGILRVREAKVSKSKSYVEVKTGVYDGWSDPRTWSIRSLDRRGISMRSLKRFTLSFGISLADIEVPAETLYAENRAEIDPTTPRRALVLDPVPVEVTGYPADLGTLPLANHPDRPELGERTVRAGPDFWLARSDLIAHPGEEIRLKDLVNVRLPAVETFPGEDPIQLEFTSRENRRLPRIQWVGRPGAVAVDLLEPDGTHRTGLGEAALASANPRDVVQFERIGFARIESDWRPGSTPVRVCYGHA
jgi:glutamyl-tRNA synthetase